MPELRERAFRQWHDLAQQSRTLGERCAAVLQQRRRARLEYAFDVWRERSLRRGEEVVVRRREGRECREAWEWWKARTKVREDSRPASAGNGAARLCALVNADTFDSPQTLAAIEFHKVRLGSRALACWRAWTPPRELSLQAIETDCRAMSSEWSSRDRSFSSEYANEDLMLFRGFFFPQAAPCKFGGSRQMPSLHCGLSGALAAPLVF